MVVFTIVNMKLIAVSQQITYRYHDNMSVDIFYRDLDVNDIIP